MSAFFDEFDDGELRGAVDGHEEIELALGRPHLGQVYMKEAYASDERTFLLLSICDGLCL
jgi:hypothetical protein